MVEIVPYPIRLSWEGDAAVASGDKMATGGEFFFFFCADGEGCALPAAGLSVDGAGGAGTCRIISSMLLVGL